MASASEETTRFSGPPYEPQFQQLGQIPSPIPDIPISAVFLVLFLVLGVVHHGLFKKNMNSGHKFVFNAMLFGFCAVRVFTCILRIAWACHPSNVRLHIAAAVFVAAGTLILFLLNVFFAQRIFRALHPKLAWSLPLTLLFKFTVFSMVAVLILIIAASIQSFFTVDPRIRIIDRDIIRAGSTFFAFVSFLPIPVVAIATALPRQKGAPLDRFGKGRLRNSIMILLLGSTLVTLGTSFRAATAYLAAPGPSDRTPWYLSKAAFYGFNLTLDFLVVAFYLLVRIDQRFHIPNGARGPYSYSVSRVNLASSPYIHDEAEHTSTTDVTPAPRTPVEKEDKYAELTAFSKDEKDIAEGDWPLRSSFAQDPPETVRRYSNQELFDDTATLAESLRYPNTSLVWNRDSGQWRLQRQSAQSLRSARSSVRSSLRTDADTVADIPPVPDLPEQDADAITSLPLKEKSRRSSKEQKKRGSGPGATASKVSFADNVTTNENRESGLSVAASKPTVAPEITAPAGTAAPLDAAAVAARVVDTPAEGVSTTENTSSEAASEESRATTQDKTA